MKEIIPMLFMGQTVLTELVDDTAWAQAIWFYNPSVLNMVKFDIIFGMKKYKCSILLKLQLNLS